MTQAWAIAIFRYQPMADSKQSQFRTQKFLLIYTKRKPPAAAVRGRIRLRKAPGDSVSGAFSCAIINSIADKRTPLRESGTSRYPSSPRELLARHETSPRGPNLTQDEASMSGADN
jgi:hypothetical protein